MKVEILYSSVANLYGEAVDIRYLKMCLPEAEFIETELNDVPAFVNDDVDMIYMGPMTENTQELIIEKLSAYKGRINELIDAGKVFLVIGNALEIFGNYIENEDGSKIEGLGIFNTYAKRKMLSRYNCLFLGELEGIKIVGFKAQFSQSYSEGNVDGLFRRIKGAGLNPECDTEGVRRNNFMGTYILGPILILNPDFTKYLLKLLGITDRALPCEEDIRKAYIQRLGEFEKNDIQIYG